MFFGAVKGCVKAYPQGWIHIRSGLPTAHSFGRPLRIVSRSLTLPFSVHIVNEMFRQNWNWSTFSTRIFRRHRPRDHREARFKAREGPVLSTAYLMFVGNTELSRVLTNQLIECTFVRPVTKTWSTGTLWPVFKFIRSQFGNLSSYTWNSPINSLCEFCLQMFSEPLVSKDTANNTQGAGSPGGQCCVRWSFKVTAVSQMSS